MAVTLPYPGMEFVPLDVLTAQEQNQLVANIEYTAEHILDATYPVGSIYMTTTLTTPTAVHNALGGTWVAWGSGRVPVGVNASDSDFSTVEKTGGGKMSLLPMQIYSEFIDVRYESNVRTSIPNWENYRKDIVGDTKSITPEASSTSVIGTNEVGGRDNGNLQPYITCYMYKRTA